MKLHHIKKITLGFLICYAFNAQAGGLFEKLFSQTTLDRPIEPLENMLKNNHNTNPIKSVETATEDETVVADLQDPLESIFLGKTQNNDDCSLTLKKIIYGNSKFSYTFELSYLNTLNEKLSGSFLLKFNQDVDSISNNVLKFSMSNEGTPKSLLRGKNGIEITLDSQSKVESVKYWRNSCGHSGPRGCEDFTETKSTLACVMN